MTEALTRIDVSRETPDVLERYLALLQQWNAHINLVAPAALGVWHARHIDDCTQLFPLLPAARGPFADLGSGAGLPGLVLAALEPEAEWHLVESDHRKAAFLREAARRLGIRNAEVHTSRIESVRLPPLHALTARALAPLDRLLPFAHNLLAPKGVALFPKGRKAEKELTQASLHWSMRVERFASKTDTEATILRLSEIRPARD